METDLGALRFEKEEKERGKRKGKVPSSKEEEKRKMATHPPRHKKMCLLRIRAFSFLLLRKRMGERRRRGGSLFSLLSAQWAFSDRKEGRPMMMVLLFALRRSKSKEREEEGFANREKMFEFGGYFIGNSTV